ncbi:hypothetical protein F5X96DRAFT_620121 [Biscogniauxia mediterranea]|nr:hypothetical protein F5X96DRAFT_620121 [Biscogniauxia mediterranea]
MMSSDRDAVAVVELVFWPPCLLATVFVAATHIRRGDKTWLPPCMPLVILGIVRIVSAAFELAASSLSPPASEPFLVISLVLDDIAIGPLFLAMIGLLMRMLEHPPPLCFPHFNMRERKMKRKIEG